MKKSFRAIFQDVSCPAAWKLYCDIFNLIDESLFINDERIIDGRILKVAGKIRTELPDSIHIHELTKEVFLSGDRLIRLFKEQMGISLRRYLLWTRMRAALKYLEKGYNLTHAAHGAGFADSAHMSRTFKDNFGFTPSFFFGKTSNVEILFCDDQMT